MELCVVRHPLAQHLIGQLRSVDTEPAQFRRLSGQLSTILMLEATQGVRIREDRVRTPLEESSCFALDQKLAVVPILRAGLGMLEAALDLFPDVAVGYIGLERDHQTAMPSGYYCKLPSLSDRLTICCDPMLATGGSASNALSLLRAKGAQELVMVCVVASPDGVARLQADHPDVRIVTAALDRGLNDRKYILPGLGDFGDRLYGTF